MGSLKTSFLPVATCSTALDLDQRVQTTYHLPALVLMENAGRSAAEYLFPYLEEPCVVVAGKGNNGGDALVIARHLLQKGVSDITVVLVQEDMGELATVQSAALKAHGCRMLNYQAERVSALEAIRRGKTIIDGILGIGLKGKARGTIPELIDQINDSQGKVFSLDVPSGLGDDYAPGFPVVRAFETLTFEVPKLCMYLPEGRIYCGTIHCLSAGFPPREIMELNTSYELITGESLPSLIRYPNPWEYKNLRGHAAVFGSSVGTTGAGILASEAVLRAGAGMVSLVADSDVYPVLASQCRSVMVKPLPPNPIPEGWGSAFSAFLIGPGWGRGIERMPLFRRLVSMKRPGVLDADGLYLLKQMLDERETPDLEGWILTPHPGEFEALTGCTRDTFKTNPLPKAKEFASRLHCVLVLKGHISYIVSPDGSIKVYDGMNPVLGTAGTGDVLAGLITGFLAQGMNSLSAALSGVLILGETAKQVRLTQGYFLSQDLLPGLSKMVWDNAEKARDLR